MASFNKETTGNEVVDHFRDQVKGKLILITGASANGLGAETALSLARGSPARLILLGRSAGRIQPVIDEIHEIDNNIEATFVAVELDKLSSIEKAVAKINSEITKLDVMINNAGIMAVPYSKNDAGIEAQLATNHVGHFALTNLLMPKLRAAGEGARIVNLTSDGHTIGPFRFDDWNFSDGKEYDGWSSYAQSKTANILFTRYLARELAKDGVATFAVHPGLIMTTSISAGMDAASSFDQINEISLKNTGKPFDIGSAFQKSAQQGVSTILVAALDPELAASSGSYMTDCKPSEAREYATSEQNVDRLWKLSEQLVGQEFKL